MAIDRSIMSCQMVVKKANLKQVKSKCQPVNPDLNIDNEMR